MAYALSPGISIVEKDFISIVPSVAASTGAFAGAFPWGPVLYPTRITSENDLVALFGKPTSSNFESFFTAANFLSYTNSLYVTRQDSTGGKNAIGSLDSSQIAAGTAPSINNIDVYNTSFSNAANTSHWAAKYKGAFGNSLKVSFADSTTYQNVFATGTSSVALSGTSLVGVSTKFLTELKVGSVIYTTANAVVGTVTAIASDTAATITAAATPLATAKFLFGPNKTAAGTYTVALGATALTGASTSFLTELHVGAVIKNTANAVVGTVTAIASDTAATITAALNALSAEKVVVDWAYASQFDSVPGTSSYALSANATNDELHVIVIDEDGVFTGIAGSVLEKFAFVSKASDARKYDGTNNYYKDVINSSSKYIWWMKHTTNVTGTTAWGSVAASASFKSLVGAMSTSFTGGVDDFTDTNGSFSQAAWVLYLDDSQYDISLLPVGKANSNTANYVIQSVCEVRKDCIAFVSPQDASGNVIVGNGSTVTDSINAYRNSLTSSSYGIVDTGYKYQYDRYNDLYRWVPLNGDIAGLAARTDYTNDAWWSPAGYNRGQIKNVVKLAVNPTKLDRDTLYKNSINPVVSFPGQGTVLFGDRTLLSKPSAFREIGVRRLFILLEKSIGLASQYQLFEFNDAFTRAQFKNIVEPFLRDVKGRRGIIDFKVVCDDTNNTGAVIDRQEFVGDIYIKPNHSINYITLNFIASRSGIDFNVIGA